MCFDICGVSLIFFNYVKFLSKIHIHSNSKLSISLKRMALADHLTSPSICSCNSIWRADLQIPEG